MRETRIAKYRPISSNTDLYIRINNIYGSFTDEINAYVYTLAENISSLYCLDINVKSQIKRNNGRYLNFRTQMRYVSELFHGKNH